MNRRSFLQMLGTAAAVTAAGLIVPDLGRKIFLPPRGGWAARGLTSAELQVGDVITFGPRLSIRRCKQFEGAVDLDRYRYDAVYTLPDGGEVMRGVEMESYADDPEIHKWNDELARNILESDMRKAGGRPGGTHFKLELPRNQLVDARYI